MVESKKTFALEEFVAVSHQDVFVDLLTPLRFLERAANFLADKPAVCYRDQVWTYAEFNRRVHALAAACRSAGIEKGDRVAVLAPNTPPMLEAHYGVPLAGGILVPINIRLSPGEVEQILSHSGAKVFIIDGQFLHLLPRTPPEGLRKVVVIRDEGAPPELPGEDYEGFIGAHLGTEVAPVVEDEREPITLNYTSGTTGRPKGAVYTHRGAYLNALGDCLSVGLNVNSNYLWVVPMFHCNGWCYTWAVTAVGATHVCLRRVDPAQIFDEVERRQVTHICAAPTVLIALTNYGVQAGRRFPHPVVIATGGAPPAPQVIADVEDRLGGRLIHLYGLTETYGPNTLCEWLGDWDRLPLEERARLKARQGIPHPTAIRLRVVDEQMRDVPRDGQTLGEVVMRGNTVMAGYFKNPEATAEAFKGGWFHSGDLAVWHPDGYIELRDRKKDIIISGGENISSVEVEAVLYSHPAVLEVAVVGAPDPYWGEVPKAYVVLKPGMSATAEELIQWVRDRLAHFKAPKKVEFVPELPKTSTGKIQKFVLRQLAQQEAAKG